MYLSELNIGEKKNFLELAKYAMDIDGKQDAEELAIYKSFVQECGFSDYELSKQNEILSVIKVLAKSKISNKRIILVELFGILLADGNVCGEEQKLMEHIAETFQIEKYETQKIKRWVIAMNDLVAEGYSLINKE